MRSRNGLLFGRFRGGQNARMKSSFMTLRKGSSPKCLSKYKMGREPRRQLPASRTSLVVWMLSTWNLTVGPEGTRASHMYKCSILRDSKKIALLQLFNSHTSLISCKLDCFSNLGSVLW